MLKRPAELRLGEVLLYASERRLSGPHGSVSLEPRVAQVFEALAEQPGVPVRRRELFERCWGSWAAGDDSLNRAIYQLRRALKQVGATNASVRTVAATGYVLHLVEDSADRAIEAARRSWRAGLPFADAQAITRLHSAVAADPSASAELHGVLALLLCRAAEYAPLEACADLVHQCERTAAQALSLDARQPDARVALSSLAPIYGDWLSARRLLLEVLADRPDHFAARHELAVLEMSTGRVAAAVPLIGALLQEDPLAATVHYKRGYHLYCLGEQDQMDRVLDRGLQLWPRHAGLWQARTLTFAFTDRAAAALALLEDEALRPPMPAPTVEFHRLALAALASRSAAERAHAIAALESGARWQSLAVAAIMYLCALGDADAAMALCERYYLRDGEVLVRLRYEPGIEASINEMHRRATQCLFLPVTAGLRAHARFAQLCERMGLAAYWEAAGVRPDFLAS